MTALQKYVVPLHVLPHARACAACKQDTATPRGLYLHNVAASAGERTYRGVVHVPVPVKAAA